MEEVDKDPEEASEASALSENQDAKKGVCTQEVDEEPSMEVCERFKGESKESQPDEEEEEEEEEEEGEEEEEEKRMISLQRDLTTSVTNIQTAADAKELIRRTELEEARRIRLERIEKNAKCSQELFEEITRMWSIAKQKVIPQELQEALTNQEQLCAAMIEDKRKLINELQQELKVGDNRYVQDLRKQAEEVDLMMERMEDQIKTLTKAYREELAQMERVYHQESEILLTRDKTEWEQKMKELWDKELERLAQRRKNVEEYEEMVHNLMLETVEKNTPSEIESSSKKGRESQKMIVKLKLRKQRDEKAVLNFSLTDMKSRICSLQMVMKDLKAKYCSQTKQFAKKSQSLSKEHERSIQQNKCLQKRINRFAGTSAKQFEDMWLMIEGEVKQLVERVLVIDSLICKQQLGIAWERPPMEFMKSSGPIHPQKHALPSCHASSQLFHTEEALQCSQRMDLLVGPRLETDTENTDMETYKEGTAVHSESGTEVEEGNLSMETLKKEVELLGDEVNVCAEASESINKADKVKTKSTTHLTSELIHQKHVVPALKSFPQQHMKSSFHVAARDTSEDKAYWDCMANIISDDKMKLWDAAEDALKQYQVVLTDISELVPETQSLKQQNTELRMLLQQSLNSRVSPEVEML